ncbi:MAG TPA: hypothetical protein VFV17_11190 [Usitatibacteraceae bacterium]|nr:hypothetical protein [Usitatibacteraceae bacterium]
MNRKRLADLTAEDFARSAIWRADLPELEFASPIARYEDLTEDEPDLALVEYKLKDGTKAKGFCFIYDETGHVVFGPGGKGVPLSTYIACTPEEAAAAAAALNRKIEDVFPVEFRGSVKVFGSYPEGAVAVRATRHAI